jgi:heme-degrading monooxygenase HmoA/predicted ester cyclase
MTQGTVPAQFVPAEELALAYIRAWNAHDGAAVAAAVTGSYVDPTLPAPLRGDALAAMVDGLCAAFPDLRFEETAPPLVAGDRMVLQWRMRGTNSGAALPGAPAPTGGTVDLPGVDVVTLAEGGIVDVVGYFDQKSFVEQLGLQVHLTPQDQWPVQYGTSLRVDVDRREAPGAMTFTWIDLADGEDAELLSRSQEVVMALTGEPGFLGFGATTVGSRFSTLTMWTSPEAAEATIARARPHQEAMARVQHDGFGRRWFTSFWQPYRINEQRSRCTACGSWTDVAQPCSCGAAAVHPTPYL